MSSPDDALPDFSLATTTAPAVTKQKAAVKGAKGAAKVTKTSGKTVKPKAAAQTKATTPKKKKAAKSKQDLNIQTIRPREIKLEAVKEDTPETARLAHGLDRILFNPGVYHMSDPRTGVFNFDPYLASIMPLDQFDFNALKEFVSSSQDTKLRSMAIAHGKKYCGSTSSMTSMLAHFHYLLSSWRPLSFDHLSQSIKPLSTNFTQFQRGPASIHAILKDGVYSFDADKQYDKETVLSMMGKSMEKLLTLPKEEFEKYRRTRSHLLTEEEKNADEAYHYTTLGDFMMRSQQDAYDPRLPGTGTFDLKTRAVVSIRMDMQSEKSTGYEIRKRFGQWNSFEREYHDMIRAAFLKYSLQVRMGRMDGIFVAFHNTQRIFGFQYVSLEEMDLALHGSDNRALGDQEFKASLALLNDLMDRATKRFPGRSLRLLVETRPTAIPLTYFFVEPVTDEDIKTSKEESQRTVEEIGHTIKDQLEEVASASQQIQQDSSSGIIKDADESPDGDEKDEAESERVWEQMMAKIEETVELESSGLQSVRQAFQDVLEPSSEEELDALMQDIEQLTAASPGMKELRDASSPDLDETLEVSKLGSDQITEEAIDLESDHAIEGSASVESGEAGAAYPSVGELEQAPEPELETGVTTRNVAESGLDQASAEPMNVVSSVDDVPENGPAPTQIEPQTDSEPSEGTEKPSSEKEDLLRRLIAQAAERMGDQEGTPLRALIARLAARAKPATVVSEGTVKADKTSAEGVESNAATQTPTRAADEDSYKEPKEVLGMYVSVQNQVNNKHVERVNMDNRELNSSVPKWKLEYSVVELSDKEAKKIHAQILKRRKSLYLEASNNQSQTAKAKDYFMQTVAKMSEEGALYRMQLERELADRPVHVVWDEDTLPPEVRNSGVTGDIFVKGEGTAGK